MSLICGNDTKDESRKAMVKRPGPPSDRAMAYSQLMKDFTRADSRYPEARHVIIARFERRLAAVAAVAAAVAWVVFLRADLVLSHYDAKAHLVVARRVIDNLTPGWQQIGAVWLP